MSEKFLNGRVIARQPEKGFRAGLDAVMLAASVAAKKGDTLLELGSGAGTASLCVAVRVKGVTVTGLEIDPELVALACENAKANRMGKRVRFVAGDLFELPKALARDFDHVFSNPPFHRGTKPPDRARARALADDGRLADWLAAGLRRTRPGGFFTCILGADRVGEALEALGPRGTRVFPLWPRAGNAARRVIVQKRKGARSPFSLMSGLVLHEADGRYTPKADAVLRDMAPLL